MTYVSLSSSEYKDKVTLFLKAKYGQLNVKANGDTLSIYKERPFDEANYESYGWIEFNFDELYEKYIHEVKKALSKSLQSVYSSMA